MNASNCTNTATLTLTINHSSTNGNATVTACDSYLWNGTTYTASGNYTYTTLNGDNCTNTATLTLTINHSSTNGDAAITACDSYLWNGTTYTASDTYTYTSLNASNCTNTATLTLTINHSSANGNATITACDSYLWNGITYTTSGTYTYTSMNASNCINTATLVLTIHASSASSESATACDSYTWSVNGNTYTASGTYSYTSLNAAACVHTNTLNLTINHSSVTNTTVSSYISYTWAANNVTYTVSGNYSLTFQNISGCDSTVTLHLTILQGIRVSPKVFLGGAYDATTGLMYDSLRVNHLIPSTEPYSAAPFMKPQVGGLGGETVSAATLAVTGSDAIVDWVYLELRSASNPSSIVATKRALVQRDGDVVDADGVSPVLFAGFTAGNYNLSIKHRNHLGIMTNAPLSLVYAPTSIDFTSPSFAVFTNSSITNSPRKIQNGVALLWGGDANNNKNVKYNGLNTDKDAVIQIVGASTLNNTVGGYRTEDVNMDGKVRYNGLDNDRSFIGAQTGVANPNTIIFQHTPN